MPKFMTDDYFHYDTDLETPDEIEARRLHAINGNKLQKIWDKESREEFKIHINKLIGKLEVIREQYQAERKTMGEFKYFSIKDNIEKKYLKLWEKQAWRYDSALVGVKYRHTKHSIPWHERHTPAEFHELIDELKNPRPVHSFVVTISHLIERLKSILNSFNRSPESQNSNTPTLTR